MFKPTAKEIKEEILGKIRNGQKVPSLASQYDISAKTIYTCLSKLVTPEITFAQYSKIKKENEELKRIIGMMALDLESEKKEKYVLVSNNKRLIAKALEIDRKRIYCKRRMNKKDEALKDKVNKTYMIHPACGYKRLAMPPWIWQK